MGKIISINVKPYTLSELAERYSVCTGTFHNWIKPFEAELGTKIGRYYSVRQVEIIFENLGYPYLFQEAA